MSLRIRVITPEEVIWNTTAQEAVLPSMTGQIGVLQNHASLITAVDIGVLRIRNENKWSKIILLGGFAEVENDEVTVLVNGVEEIKEDSLEAAKAELEAASLTLKNAESSKEKMEASENLKLISARINALTYL